MFHGTAFLNATQQSGQRGSDKIFSTSWLMPMAQRKLGPGTFTARAMFSLEPATITGERYPELFQTGETAYGNPIVDGQHPHNFLMELAALYDVRLGENTLLSLYAAPVGDPAMGPEGFPHRPTASEDPLAPLGHHMQDSTHISNDVITAGLAYKIARVEFSGFHGREPDEFRWDLDSGAVDSWSARLTLNPSSNWSGQFSIARLKSPEELFPLEDTLRSTASVSYNRGFARGNWASMILWGRNLALPGGEVLNSYLAESTLRFRDRNYAWTRIENVDRTNLLLLRRKSAADWIRGAFPGARPGLHLRLRPRIRFPSARLDGLRRPVHFVHRACFARRHLWRAPRGRAAVHPLPRHPLAEIIPRRMRMSFPALDPLLRASKRAAHGKS